MMRFSLCVGLLAIVGLLGGCGDGDTAVSARTSSKPQDSKATPKEKAAKPAGPSLFQKVANQDKEKQTKKQTKQTNQAKQTKQTKQAKPNVADSREAARRRRRRRRGDDDNEPRKIQIGLQNLGKQTPPAASRRKPLRNSVDESKPIAAPKPAAPPMASSQQVAVAMFTSMIMERIQKRITEERDLQQNGTKVRTTAKRARRGRGSKRDKDDDSPRFGSKNRNLSKFGNLFGFGSKGNHSDDDVGSTTQKKRSTSTKGSRRDKKKRDKKKRKPKKRTFDGLRKFRSGRGDR